MQNEELAEYYAQMGIDHGAFMEDGLDIGGPPFANHEQLIDAMMADEPNSTGQNFSGVKIASLSKL